MAKLISNSQSIVILYSIFLITAASACNSQSQSNMENQTVQAKNLTPAIENKTDTIRLKYTTGIRAFLEDSKGNTWFGSYNEGACMLHNGKLRYFTTANGLSDNQVRNIYEDANGIIWFECGRGLSTYNGQQMFIYRDRNYGAKNKWELSGTDLWFKSDPLADYNSREGDKEGNPGILQYNGKELLFHSFPVAQDSGDIFDHSVSTRFVKGKDGFFWIGSYKSVIGYNGSDFKIITDEYLRLNGVSGILHVRDVMIDSKGNLWIANNGSGIFKYDGVRIVNFTAQQKLKKEDTKENSLERVFSIGEDATGNIWFGTVASGVWRYDGTAVKNFTKADGLESNHIWSIYKSKQGALWFGGAGPSAVYSFNGKSFERIY